MVRARRAVERASCSATLRDLVNEALSALEREFAPALFASIPPEKLLRAMRLQALYSIRSERLLMERLDYDLLFRWLVGIAVDDTVWNHSVFSKNASVTIGSPYPDLT